MNNNETIYDKIQIIIGNLNGKLNIFEEEVDITLQLEYFELSKNFKKGQLYIDKKSALEILDSQKSSEQDLKNALISLTILNDVEALRAIEQFQKKATKNIQKWALIAYHENKMLIESCLLEQDQIFISTGIGGKNGKLRYYLIIPTFKQKELTSEQKDLIHEEFKEVFFELDSEIEEIIFTNREYVFISALAPLKISVKRLFSTAIAKCNEYGNLLNIDFIVTNVKRPNHEEILNYFFGKKP